LLEMLINHIVGIAVPRRDSSGGRNRNRARRRKSIEKCCRHRATGSRECRKCKRVGALVRTLILPDREIERVLVVGEGLVTDAKTGAHDRLFRNPVGKAKTRSKVLIIRFAAQVTR